MLTSVSLIDCGPHEKLDLDLDHKVLGITGKNGSGKSSLIRGLYYGLTGDYGPLGGAKANRIGATNPGSVTLTAELSCLDDSIEIYRRLPVGKLTTAGNDSRYLKINDQQNTTYKNEDDIKRQLETWFGLPTSVLGEFVFIPQGRLCDIVSATPGSRMRRLSTLAGLDRAEKVWESLGKHSQIHVSDNATTIAEVKARIVETEDRVKSYERKLKSLPTTTQKDFDDANTLIAQQKIYEFKLSTRNATVEQLKQTEKSAKFKLETVQSIKSQLDELIETKADADECRQAIKDWKSIRSYEKQIEDITRIREEIKQLDQTRVEPGDRPTKPERLESLEQNSSLIEELACSEVDGPCPVCKAKAGDIKSAISSAKKEREELIRLKDKFAKDLQAWRQSDAIHSSITKKLTTLNTDLAFKIGGLSDVKPQTPQIEEDVAQQLIEAFDELGGDSRIAKLKKQVDDASVSLAAAELSIDGLRAKLKEPIDIKPVDPKVIDYANKVIEFYHSRVAEENSINGQLESLRYSLSKDRQLLHNLEKENDTISKKVAWSERCGRVRDVLHRNAAPAEAALQYIKSTGEATNKWLELMKADFRIEVTSDCSFTANFDDDKVIPASMLSGGQLAVLALAWHAAIQDTNSENLWLLCLDEPTYGLDDIRMAALVDAIDGWRKCGGDRQLIVVTHDTKLADACDHVIDLSRN